VRMLYKKKGGQELEATRMMRIVITIEMMMTRGVLIECLCLYLYLRLRLKRVVLIVVIVVLVWGEEESRGRRGWNCCRRDKKSGQREASLAGSTLNRIGHDMH
jgi:hypothetical protein